MTAVKKILRIRRKKRGEDRSYWEDFPYESGDGAATVASALMELPVAWEHSCLQKKCGACAMVINGRPALACDTVLADLRGELVTIEPLRKFSTVEDLLVDRGSMMDRLLELKVYLSGEAKDGSEALAFEASKCLQCGLCLEVCPSFCGEDAFGGMAAMAPLARLLAMAGREDEGRLFSAYKKHVYADCAKSLACQKVCPAGIEIDKLLARSSAAALFRRLAVLKKEGL